MCCRPISGHKFPRAILIPSKEKQVGRQVALQCLVDSTIRCVVYDVCLLNLGIIIIVFCNLFLFKSDTFYPENDNVVLLDCN